MKKGEIWLVDLPVEKGHEQSGFRPVLVFSDVEANTVIIVPFTTNLQTLKFLNTVEVNPSDENKLKEVSVALVFQTRAIDVRRLQRKVGNLEKEKIKEIEKVLKRKLEI